MFFFGGDYNFMEYMQNLKYLNYIKHTFSFTFQSLVQDQLDQNSL